MRMGAIPYRDIYDINMPLIYFIHLAVVAIGGMSDVAWRAFDLASAAAMSGLILMVVWPAGRALAIHAALIALIVHLLLRSEEHTSELQSLRHLVCRLL